jgi:predicted nucleic acid-binding Zn ribbon protein
MAERPSPPEECANCGTKIPRHAQACPECGADERTGWRETDATNYDGLDLPDSAYVDEPASPPARRGIAWYWYVVAALLVASLVLGLISFR